MQKVALALVVVGALLAWAYYAPRIVATLRRERNGRAMVARRNGRAADREFERIMRRTAATDPAWTARVRHSSRIARWAGRNHNRDASRFNFGGPVR